MKNKGFYSNRKLMSYDRNKYPYRGIIGARGIGKSFSAQNLTCNLYHKVKHIEENVSNIDDMFLWLRLTPRAVDKMKAQALDPVLQKKHNIKADIIDDRIYYNGRLMGHILALSDMPVIKGGVWQWQRYRYVILDEFQRERKERRTFDIVYNLRSILESVCRFSTRLKLGMDLPTVIFMGNTVDEATDLLYAFDFMPYEFGMYKLKSKHAIIEYAPNSTEYDRLQAVNPLKVLNTGDDYTFGERRLINRHNIIDWQSVGHKSFIAYLHLSEFIRLEVWQTQNGYIYISKGLEIGKKYNNHYVLHKSLANKGTFYLQSFFLMIRDNYEKNNIYFDKRITAQVFEKYWI